jgi:tagatose-6-phosphate ketose/aldose isomerase
MRSGNPDDADHADGRSPALRSGSGSGLSDASASIDAWLASLAAAPPFDALLAASPAEQRSRGYGDTLREICQQPLTWPATADTMAADAGAVRRTLEAGGIPDRGGSIVLTGSGSSFFGCECAAAFLQESLGVPCRALPAGAILTHPRAVLPPSGPYLAVSLARSGDSPESAAVVERLLLGDGTRRISQLLITCNAEGALARRFGSASLVAGVSSIVLPPVTNDRSLVMTSSFTNLVLAARALAAAGDAHRRSAVRLAAAARAILSAKAAALAAIARRAFSSVVYLGSGPRLGSVHEAALKMLESTAGRVVTLSDSFLGLRHGPMAAVAPDSLIVAFLSSDPVVRAFERDVLLELRRKGLGRWRVIVGDRIPAELASEADDLRVDVEREGPLDDGELTLIDALVGQLLAFFRCLELGARPDSPSASGAIRRVVESFAIHAGS